MDCKRIVTVTEAFASQQRGGLIVDVRECDEFAASHVPGAHHVPAADVESRIAEIPRDRDVLLFCRSGRRSGKAQDLLIERYHFTNVANVEGGILAWEDAQLPLEAITPSSEE